MKVFEVFKNNIKKHENIVINILSITFTLLLIFGTSYMILGTGNLVFGSFINLLLSVFVSIILFVFIRIGLSKLFDYLDSGKIFEDNSKVSKFRNYLEKHPIKFSMIFLIICWLPYIISFFPAILAPDPAYQILEYFGFETKFSNSFYSPFYNNSLMPITNHHPFVHTLIIGTCVKIGKLLGSVNFGLFIYTFMQILVFSYVLARTIKYMNDSGIPYKLKKFFLLFYAFVPMFPLYAMNPVKDVIFTCFVILYILFIIDRVKNKENKINIRKICSLIFIIIGMMLMRHNGLHLVVLSLPFLIIVNKKNRIALVGVLLFTFMFNYTYNNIFLKKLNVVPSSIKEQLSIPFQQTARYVTYYENELSSDEYEKIDKVLNMNTLKLRYKPENSDPVKDEFNSEALIHKEYMNDYFGVWFKCLFRHPTVYIDATINNVYGYFYPFKTNWYVYFKTNYKNQDRIQDYGFDYHFNGLEIPRKVLSVYGEFFQYVPIIGFLCNIGINSWLLFILTGYIIYKRRRDGIVVLLPSLITLLICIASPVNCYYRYVLPLIFAMPLTICFVLDYTRKGVSYEE